jgi:hypothetical protein
MSEHLTWSLRDEMEGLQIGVKTRHHSWRTTCECRTTILICPRWKDEVFLIAGAECWERVKARTRSIFAETNLTNALFPTDRFNGGEKTGPKAISDYPY